MMTHEDKLVEHTNKMVRHSLEAIEFSSRRGTTGGPVAVSNYLRGVRTPTLSGETGPFDGANTTSTLSGATGPSDGANVTSKPENPIHSEVNIRANRFKRRAPVEYATSSSEEDGFELVEEQDVTALHFQDYRGESLRELARVYGLVRTTRRTLRDKGWPAEFINAYLSMTRKSVPLVEDKYSVVKQVSSAPERNWVERGENADHWIFPEVRTKYPQVLPKPDIYATYHDHRRVVHWMCSLAQHLTKGLLPHQYVTGNFAAKTLFYGEYGHASKKAEQALLQMARVYVESYKFHESDFSRKPYVHIPERFIRIGSNFCVWPQDLKEYAYAFAKHKNAYYWAVKYLRGDPDCDYERIQSIIDNKVIGRLEDFQLHHSSRKNFMDGERARRREEREIVKTEFQGFLDTTLTVEHKLMLDVSKLIGPDKGRDLLRYSAFVTALFTTTSLANFIAVLTAFVTSSDFLYGKLMKILSRFDPLPQLQAGEWFFALGASFKTAIVSFLAEVGITSLLSMISETMFSGVKLIVAELAKGVQKQCVKLTATTAGTFLCEFVMDSIIRLKECYSLGSLAPLWGETYSPMSWVKTASAMEEYYTSLTGTHVTASALDALQKLRAEGKVPKSFTTIMTPYQFTLVMQEHCNKGELLLAFYRDFAGVGAVLGVALRTFRRFLSQKSVQCSRSGSRVQPYFMFFYGNAGTGKTAVLEKLRANIARVYDLPITTDGVYVWQPNANFQDGFNHAHWAVVLDDVDHLAPASGQKSAAHEIVSLVNVSPFPIQQADIADKGRYECAATLVTLSSNFPYFNAEKHHSFFKAPLRRVSVRVRLTVNPPFALPGGGLNVAAIAGVDHRLLHTFHVSFVQGSETNSPEDLFTKEKAMDYDSFARLNLQMYKKHMETQLARVQASVSTDKVCSLCGSDQYCSCQPPVVVPGNIVEVSAPRSMVVDKDKEPVVDRRDISMNEWLEDVLVEDITSASCPAEDEECTRVEVELNVVKTILQGHPDCEEKEEEDELVPWENCFPSPPGFSEDDPDFDYTPFWQGEYDWDHESDTLKQLRRIIQYQNTCALRKIEELESKEAARRKVRQILQRARKNVKPITFRDMLRRQRRLVLSVWNNPSNYFSYRALTSHFRHTHTHHDDFRLMNDEEIASVHAQALAGIPMVMWYAGHISYQAQLFCSFLIVAYASLSNTWLINHERDVVMQDDNSWLGLPNIRREIPYLTYGDNAYNHAEKGLRNIMPGAVKKFVEKYNVQLALIGVIGALVAAYLAVRKSPSDVTKQEGQSRLGNANPGLVDTSWNRLSQDPPRQLFDKSSGKDLPGLLTMLRGSCLSLSSINEDGTKICSYGYIVGTDHILATTHSCPVGRKLTYSQLGVSYSVTLAAHNVATLPSNKEICIVRAPSVQKGCNASRMFVEAVDQSVYQYDDAYLTGVDIATDVPALLPRVRNVGGTKTLVAQECTEEGDCGRMYVACFNGKWYPIAMHYALFHTHNGEKLSGGALISRLEVERVIESMGDQPLSTVVHQGVFCKSDADITLSKFTPKSSIWAARSHSGRKFYSVGRIDPPIAINSMKSKIKRSMISEDFEDFEEEVCGKRGYWTVPKFAGRMLPTTPPVWEDAYTNAFATQCDSEPLHYFFVAALKDYLMGADKLLTSGYAPLTDEQVVSGVPESYIGSVNLDTSVGPPFNVGKRSHIVTQRPELASFMSPELYQSWMDIRETLSQGLIPQIVGVCSPKDEATKDGKLERIFTVYPAGYNFELKKFVGPILAFMRANYEFFESAVGIDMTSSEVMKVVTFLKSVDPALQSLSDMDVKAMDKSWNSYSFYYMDRVWFALAFILFDKRTADYVFRLTSMERHVILCAKNDLFMTTFHGSGQQDTVEKNGVLTSLHARYMFYRQEGLPESEAELDAWFRNFFVNPVPEHSDNYTFRKKNALLTYGDDSVKAKMGGESSDYPVTFLRELGMIITPADKNASFSDVKDLSQIDFLKRKFVWDDDLRCYKAPLSLKSICRMLVIKRDTKLSDADAAATSMAEALRESVYHGREFYEKMYSKVYASAVKFGLVDNPCFVVKSYDQWFELLREGKFRAWVVRGQEELPELVLSDKQYQSGSSLRVGKLPSNSYPPPTTLMNPSSTTITPIDGVNVHSEVASTPSTTIVGVPTRTAEPQFTPPQNLPASDPTDSLTMLTYIGTTNLPSSDSTGTVVSILPIYQFLDNPVTIARLKYFLYLQAEFTLVGVFSATGAAYGGYAVSAMPQGHVSGINIKSDDLHYPNHAQMDTYTILDVTQPETFTFDLPWVHQHDYSPCSDLNGLTSAEDWKICVSVISPVTPVFSGTVASAKIRWYIAMKPGYQLVGRVLQGKLKKAAGSALSAVAPGLHSAIGDGKGSAMMKTVSDTAAMFTNVPMLGGAAAAVETLATGAGAVLGWLGFSRTMQDPKLVRMINTSSGARCVDADDNSIPTGLFKSNQLSVDTSGIQADDEDEMHFSKFAGRLTLARQETWTSDLADGYTLFTFYISPMQYHDFGGTEALFSPAGYAGLLFNYWRGTCVLTIKVFASEYHTGILQFHWQPFYASSTADPTNATHSVIMDIAQSTETVMRIGYSSNMPMLETHTASFLAASLASASNGKLVCRVRSQLLSPTSVPIHVVAYVSWEDLEFAVPRGSVEHNLLQYSFITGITYQSKIDLVQPTLDPKIDSDYMGERVLSLRPLAQKSCLIKQVGPVQNYIYPVGYGNASDTSDYWFTWARHCVLPFQGFSASERYKIYSPTTVFVGASKVLAHASDSYELTGTVAPLCPMIKTQYGYTEVQVPYYQRQKFLFSRMTYPITGYPATRIEAHNWGTDTTNYFRAEFSFAPDLKVTHFRQIPSIEFVARAGGNPL